MENTSTINQDILKTLRRVSLIFFIIIGSTHLLTALFSSQNIWLPLSNIINKTMDIPFALIATIYGLSNAKISQDSKFKKIYLALFIIICLSVLAIMLYFNFLPDRISN